jgi:serine/threonine protein kinase
MCSIELRNINIEQLKNNPNMKPKRNPIHKNFIDDKQRVFDKFGLNEPKQIMGGNNTIYYNSDFAIRISKLVLNISNEKYDFDKHIDVDVKNTDEEIMKKAIKHGLCPRVYMFGNILMDHKIHRYCVMESYDTSLRRFLKKEQYIKLLKSENCIYKSINELNKDISDQIVDLCKRTRAMNIVYYDFKPDNIVLKIENGRVILNMIDWDEDFCIEEKWLQEYGEAVDFLNLVICAYFMYYYGNYNILYSFIKETYTRELINDIFNIIIKTKNQYLTIIIHYFYKSFGMSEEEKERFDYNFRNEGTRMFVKTKICDMIKTSCRMCH